MHSSVVVLLLFVGAVVVGLANGNCDAKEVPPDVCAIVYDKEDCQEGINALVKSPNYLKEGELDLFSEEQQHDNNNNNNNQSVKVNKDCTFRGYVRNTTGGGILEVTGIIRPEEVIERKGLVVVAAGLDHKTGWANFKAGLKRLSCRCGNQGHCPVVPPYLCAIAYDRVGCDVGEFPRPLEIPVSKHLDLIHFSSPSYNRNIESISVRKGCTFQGFKEPELDAKHGAVNITADSAGGDAHVDLSTTEQLPNAIQSLSCSCS